MGLAIIYSRDYEKLNYGAEHPFRKERFTNLIKLIRKIRPETPIIEPYDYDSSLLELVHDKSYINHVRQLSDRGYGALSIDTPVFPGIFEWAVEYCWGSLTATELILDKKFTVAFNPCGGLHHAKRDSDGGFCIFNDVALSAVYARNNGARVAIVDIDGHAGDGTMRILYNLDILKISIHEDPMFLYPGDGFIHQIGEGKGYGYTINIPLPMHSTDDILINVFNEIVIPALKKFNPSILILQSGVDGYFKDPLTHLGYTSYGYREISRLLRDLRIPIVALGGGGYYIEYVPILWLNIILTLTGEYNEYRHILDIDPKPSVCKRNICDKAKRVIKEIKQSHPFFSNL